MQQTHWSLQNEPTVLRLEPHAYARPQYHTPLTAPKYYAPPIHSQRAPEYHNASRHYGSSSPNHHQQPALPRPQEPPPCFHPQQQALPTQQQQQRPLPFQKNEFAAVEERLYMCKMGLRRLVSLSRFDQQRLAQDIADRIEQDVVWLARGFQEEQDFEYLRIVRGPDTIPRPTVVSTTRDAASFTVIRRGVVQQPEVPRGTTGPMRVNLAPIPGVTSDLQRGSKKSRRQHG
jgi:hypothetical protein